MLQVANRFARTVFRNYVYTIRHGIATGLKRRGGLGFLPKSSLTKEERFLMTLDLKGQTVYDIGGWEGVFTLFFARAVGDTGFVVTFEPNPDSYSRILENVDLNHFSNVVVRMIALGKESRRDTLVFSAASLGTGSLNGDIKKDLLLGGAKTIQVDVDKLDHQVIEHGLSRPDFVKIDVEGLEFDVLVGMSNTIDQCKPKLYIEIHGANVEKKIENARNVVGLLSQKGYTIRRIESDEIITDANADHAKEGHLYCE